MKPAKIRPAPILTVTETRIVTHRDGDSLAMFPAAAFTKIAGRQDASYYRGSWT